MSLRFPDFLGSLDLQPPNGSGDSSLPSKQQILRQPQKDSDQDHFAAETASRPAPLGSGLDSNLDFDLLLTSKLSALGNTPNNIDDLNLASYSTPFSPMAGAHDGFGLDGSSNFPGLPDFGPFHAQKNTFHLPLELQGGISNISSRRPSYAAELFTRSQQQPVGLPSQPFAGSPLSNFNPATTSSNKHSLASFAAANNFSMNSSQQQQQQQQSQQHRDLTLVSLGSHLQPNYGQDALAHSLLNFSLNTNLSDFQARRPSQLADYQAVPQQQFYPSFNPQLLPFFSSGPASLSSLHSSAYQQAGSAGMSMSSVPPSAPQNRSPSFTASSPQVGGSGVDVSAYAQALPGQTVKLDNGLLLKDQYIMASDELKQQFLSASKYFQDVELSDKILSKLHELLGNPVVQKLITFVRNLNNLTFNHKMLCLVVNKNGKLDLLSYPSSSNIFLQRDNLVIVDGDRGKDLVMILEPLVNLEFAILFNFLKKIEHLKSLTINDANGGTSVKGNHSGGTHSTSMDASTIINKHSNEDNEFIITLPTKQVLRFATPKEIQKLSGKFLEEKKAFITCFNKIKELGLNNDLTLINVEYQCDFKKLIFYYYAGFKRIDFRGLIKELFKIYKTRIWLCAVLPYDRRELYTSLEKEKGNDASTLGSIPKEYELSNEQILNFSVKEFNKLPKPSYFHLRNMYNLVLNLESDLGGKFYGFTQMSDLSGIEQQHTAGSGSRSGNGRKEEFSNPSPGGKNSKQIRKNSYQMAPKFDPFGGQKNV